MDVTGLSKYLKTTRDADDFKNTLDHLSDSLYKTESTAEAAIQNTLPYDQAAVVLKIATEHGVNTINKADVQKFLNDLRNAVSAIPTVQVTLAFKPKAKLVGIMSEWFYRNYHKVVLLDIVVKSDLIGGSIVSYNGKYYDYSLQKETVPLFGSDASN